MISQIGSKDLIKSDEMSTGAEKPTGSPCNFFVSNGF